jgi:hypothetical protein
MRQHAGNHGLGRGIVKYCYVVHGLKRRQYFSALFLGEDGPSFAFQLTNASVAVDGNKEKVAELSGIGQVARMAGMQQVKTAVGEDNPVAASLMPVNHFVRVMQPKDL